MCILLLFPTLAWAQQQPAFGSPVAEVRLPVFVDPADFGRIRLHAGDIITAKNVRESIDALYETRHYQTISVEASRETAGIVVTFRAEPFFFLSGVRLEPSDLLERSLMSYVQVPLGSKFSKGTVERIAKQARQLLEDRGYFEAIIHPEYTFDKDKRTADAVLKATVRPRAVVSSITLDGGEGTFSGEELLKALDVKSGDSFSPEKLGAGVGRVRQKFTKLGFLNTQIDVQRSYDTAMNTMAIRVHVDPGQFALVTVRSPTNEPINEVSKDDLRTLIPIFEEGIVDRDLIEEGRDRLERFLVERGYFGVTVTWQRDDAPKNPAVQITYTVDKGELRRLNSIKIQGAHHFSDDRIKQVMQVRASGGKNQGLFSNELLDTDLQKIQTLYRNDGFLDATVTASQQEDARKESLSLIVDIVEGPRYRIAQLILSGNMTVSEADLRKALELKSGDPYTASNINEAIKDLMGAYHSRGYSEARIVAARENATATTINVTFKITEGDVYRIGDIVVSGNTRTATKIVRRDSLLQSGAPYDDEALLAEQHRLYATGLFTRVQIQPLDDSRGPNRDVLVYVEDANPILIAYGVGYEDYEGPRGTFEITHSNLWGLDRTLSSRIRLGQKERSFQASYREPRLFNHKIQGFATLFIEKAERPYFTSNTVDFSLQTIRRLSGKSNLITTASYQTVNEQSVLVNPEAGLSPDSEGIIQIARIGASLVQDHRDDVLDPHRGMFQTTTFQVASTKLGSEVNFTSLFNQTVFYIPQGARVLAFSSRVGWKHPFGGDLAVPISERYFAGGSTTLRSFSLDELRAGGGHLLTIGNVEYRAPLFSFKSSGLRGVILKGIGGALFYDTGNVFTRPADFGLREFTHTAGVGLRASTPLGPIRLDLGVNLAPRFRLHSNGQIEKDQRFRLFLTLGNAF